MSLSAQFVPYGRPGAVRLQALLAELRGADPLAPATVVVPRSWVGLSLRRQLASGTVSATPGAAGLANVRFPTLDHLAEELGGPVLQARGRTPLTSTAVAAAARAALRVQPGVLAPVAEHAATEAAVADSWRALRDATPADLHALGGRGRRQADVVRLTADVGCRLAGSYDARDAATAAVEALGRDASLVAGAGPFVVHLPVGLPPHHLALLRALGAVTTVVVQVGVTGDPSVDAEAHDLVRDLGATCTGIELLAAPGATAAVAAPDADTEVLAALRDVAARVAAGTPLDRIAIAYGPASPYAALLHERCAAAGLPVVGPATRTLAQTLAGRALLGALDLHTSAWRRDDVVAWLATAPLQHRGHVVDAVEADRLSRRAGVTRGRERWLSGLAALADELDRRRGELPFDEGRGVEGLARQAARARELSGFLQRVTELLEPDPSPDTWQHWSRWARQLLGGLLGGVAQRGSWPAPERQAYEAVEAVLERLARLDALDPAPNRARFLRTLVAELAVPAPQTARFGTGLLIGPYRTLVGLDFDVVHILGAADGALTPRPTDDALLPDADRAAAGPRVPLLADRAVQQRRDWLAALATAPEVVLSFARGDQRTGREQRPSRWWLDAVAQLTDAGRTLYASDLADLPAHPAVRVLVSHPATVRAAGEPVDERDLDQRELARWTGSGRPVHAHWLVRSSPRVHAGLLQRRARRTGTYDRFEGRVRLPDLPSPVDRSSLSATTLEDYAACPRRYFLKSVLGVHPPERPEDVLEVEPRTAGTVEHRILERFIAEQLQLPAGERIRPGQTWSAADHERIDAIATEVFAGAAAQGLTGHPVLWGVDAEAIRRDVHRVLDADDGYRLLHRAVPEAVEHSFGPHSGNPVEIELADGRTLRFKGFIDRIDRTADGGAVVLDYKRAAPRAYAELDADPVKRGRLLQLPLYGQAAREALGVDDVHVGYWFVSHRGSFSQVGYQLDDARFARFREVVEALVAGIEAGDYPARPVDPVDGPHGSSTCTYCDFQEACQVRRERTWVGVSRAPELRPLLAVLDQPYPATSEVPA